MLCAIAVSNGIWGTALGLPVSRDFGKSVFKAPSRFHQMASYYFYPASQKLEIGGFSPIFPKPEVIERYCLGLNVMCP